MAQTLSIKVTNKYVGTYDYLDQWRDIGTFKVVAEGPVKRSKRDDEELYDLTSQLLVVKVKSDAPQDDIRRALDASHTKAGCHHDWDCCGCRSYYGQAEHLKDRLWQVVVTSSRNY